METKKTSNPVSSPLCPHKKKRDTAPALGSRIQKNQPSSPSACLPPEPGRLSARPTHPGGAHSGPLGGGEGRGSRASSAGPVCVPRALEMEHKTGGPSLTTAATAHPQSFLIISPFLSGLLATPYLGLPPTLLLINPQGADGDAGQGPSRRAHRLFSPAVLGRRVGGRWVLARSHTGRPRLPAKGRPESVGAGHGGQEGESSGRGNRAAARTRDVPGPGACALGWRGARRGTQRPGGCGLVSCLTRRRQGGQLCRS